MQGPDGFSILFFRRFQLVVKGGIINLMEEVYNGFTKLDRLTYAKVVLIPKHETLEAITDVRPILWSISL